MAAKLQPPGNLPERTQHSAESRKLSQAAAVNWWWMCAVPEVKNAKPTRGTKTDMIPPFFWPLLSFETEVSAHGGARPNHTRIDEECRSQKL